MVCADMNNTPLSLSKFREKVCCSLVTDFFVDSIEGMQPLFCQKAYSNIPAAKDRRNKMLKDNCLPASMAAYKILTQMIHEFDCRVVLGVVRNENVDSNLFQFKNVLSLMDTEWHAWLEIYGKDLSKKYIIDLTYGVSNGLSNKLNFCIKTAGKNKLKHIRCFNEKQDVREFYKYFIYKLNLSKKNESNLLCLADSHI